MQYLIGIDIGTSATKIILMNEDGKIISSLSKGYEMFQPQNGWAEQNPEDWKNIVLSSLKEIIQKSSINSDDIKGIGLSGQMHGVVLLNKEGKPIRKSIIWCDQRSDEQAKEMEEILSFEDWLNITGNPPLAAWSAAKILWIKQNEPKIFSECEKILLPKDYIRFVLTGEFATDVSDASGTQLLDMKKRGWSQEILDKLKIEKEMLPKVYESHQGTGKITKEISEITGLSTSTIVAAGASDNAAAAVGMGAVNENDSFATIGTSAIIYTHLEKYQPIPKGSLHICCSAVDGCWHTMGGPQAAGLSLQWFADNFCHEYAEEAKIQNKNIFETINTKVEKIKVGSDRLIYMPYLMGERTPHMNPDCRGVFFGLSSVHTKANLLRAIMEGIGYSMADCNSILDKLGIHIKSMRICGGGSKSKIWRQILSDVLDVSLVTMQQDEGPALGAAILAGVSSGVYRDVKSACKNLLHEKEQTYQISGNVEVYKKYHKLYQNIYDDIERNFKILASLN